MFFCLRLSRISLNFNRLKNVKKRYRTKFYSFNRVLFIFIRLFNRHRSRLVTYDTPKTGRFHTKVEQMTKSA